MELNIKPILDLGEATERIFFNWLRDNHIDWIVYSSNLNYITIVNEKDINKIVEYWKELSF